jgi:hypothetical protein
MAAATIAALPHEIASAIRKAVSEIARVAHDGERRRCGDRYDGRDRGRSRRFRR